jgi:GT2 family glycosyltransferase
MIKSKSIKTDIPTNEFNHYEQTDMKVYTIIVTFNGSIWIERCLDGMRKSTILSNIIIVDNNSTDNTVYIIKTFYPEVMLIESKVNAGFGKANNIGIAAALKKGADYFFLLNQDARIFPNTLQTLIDANKKHPEYLAFSPVHLDGTAKKMDYNFIRYIKNSDKFISDISIAATAVDEVYPLPFINAAFWLLSKECILRIGGFDPLYKHYGEDEDYIHRINYHGYKIGFCPAVYGAHDRNQLPLPFHQLSGEKRFNRHYKNYMIDLKNINQSFSLCIFIVFKKISIQFITSLYRLKFHNCLVEIKAALYLSLQINKVLRHRSLIKSEGPAFLENFQNLFNKKVNFN